MGTRHRASVVVYVVICVLVAAVVVLGTLESVVAGPLSMTDDEYGLAEIYDIVGWDLLAGGLAMSAAWALLGIGCTIVAGFLLRAREPVPVLTIAAVGATLVWLGTLSRFWVAFGVGNTVSDEVPPYVGGLSPLGWGLYWLGAVAFGALLAILVVALVRALLRRRAAL